MEDSERVSDPTDFATTQLPFLSPVDALLRCQICKDFLANAVITSCCHTFCSLCIRRSLSAEGKCPTCRSTELESRLRRNVVVQELVDAYSQARPHILTCAQLPRQPSPTNSEAKSSKRKRHELDDHTDDSRSARLPRTRGQHKNAQGLPSSATTFDPSTASVPPSYPSSDQPRELLADTSPQQEHPTSDSLVPCPVCNSLMKPEDVFHHLDTCNGQDDTPKDRKSEPSPKVLEKLPQLNYSLFKENSLRKKLSDLGIPSSGPKQILIKRHTEWINLWNANCDSARPASRRQLLSDLDSWERSLGSRAKSFEPNGLATSAGSIPGSSGGVMRKDFDGAAWAKQNKGSFDALIASARRTKPSRNSSDEGNASKHKLHSTHTAFPVSSPPDGDSSKFTNGHSRLLTEEPLSTTVSDQPNRGLSRSIDTGRRFSSPVPGFSPRLSRDSTRDTPPSPGKQSPPTPPKTDGRRAIRRGSMTIPTVPPLHAETSLPDRIFKKVLFIDGEEAGVRKNYMFEMPCDPVAETDTKEADG